MQLSDLTREISLFSEQWLMQKQMIRGIQISVSGVLSHKWEICITLTPDPVKDHHRRKIVKARGLVEPEPNSVFCT